MAKLWFALTPAKIWSQSIKFDDNVRDHGRRCFKDLLVDAQKNLTIAYIKEA